MKPSVAQIKLSLPTSTGNTLDWISWDELNRKRFGKTAAKNLFGIAVKENGLGSGVNKEKLREATGYALNDDSLLDAVNTATDDIADVLSFTGNIGKVVLFTTLGVGAFLLVGIAVRLVFIKPEDAGVVAGTAVKYAVKKG
jgi:hypothetical protein